MVHQRLPRISLSLKSPLVLLFLLSQVLILNYLRTLVMMNFHQIENFDSKITPLLPNHKALIAGFIHLLWSSHVGSKYAWFAFSDFS